MKRIGPVLAKQAAHAGHGAHVTTPAMRSVPQPLWVSLVLTIPVLFSAPCCKTGLFQYAGVQRRTAGIGPGAGDSGFSLWWGAVFAEWRSQKCAPASRP